MGGKDSKSAQPNPNRLDLSHFKVLKTVGQGGFGKVNAIMKIDSNELFALKRFSKDRVVKEKKIMKMIMAERGVMILFKSPFLCHVVYAFDDPLEAYLVMPFMEGGDLRFHMNKKPMTEDAVRFYAAEMILGLQELYNLHIIYRDFKPDNILLDHDGHLRISDFGLAKITTEKDHFRTKGYAGTSDYMAPEMIDGESYNHSVDVWSFAVTIYEMLHGFVPWKQRDIPKGAINNNIPPSPRNKDQDREGEDGENKHHKHKRKDKGSDGGGGGAVLPELIDLPGNHNENNGKGAAEGQKEGGEGDDSNKKKKKKKSSKKDKDGEGKNKKSSKKKGGEIPDDVRDIMGVTPDERTSRADIRSREVDVHDDNYEEVTKLAKLEYGERYKSMHISHSITKAARHFLKSILRVDVHKRLGCGEDGWEEVKRHEFFEGIDWDVMASRELKAPIQPDPDVSNCSNTAYALDVLGGGPKPKKISPDQQRQFDSWAYNTELPPPGTVVKKVPISRRI